MIRKELGIIATIIVILLFAFNSNADAGLLGSWKMEDNWSDSSGNENDGTSYGATFADSGKEGLGRCGSFGGDGDYVNCGSDSSLDFTDAVTIEAWARTSKTGVYQGIGGIETADPLAYSGFSLSKWSNDMFVFQFSNVTRNYVFSNSAYTDSNWHYIVGVHDGTTGYLYVDGVKQTQTIKAGIANADVDCVIGRYYGDASSYPFNGTIDEVRIWDRALTKGEIEWQNDHPGQIVPEPSALLLLGSGLLGILAFRWKIKVNRF